MHFSFNMYEKRQLLRTSITVNPCTFILLKLYWVASNAGNKMRAKEFFRSIPRLWMQRLEIPKGCKAPEAKAQEGRGKYYKGYFLLTSMWNVAISVWMNLHQF